MTDDVSPETALVNSQAITEEALEKRLDLQDTPWLEAASAIAVGRAFGAKPTVVDTIIRRLLSQRAAGLSRAPGAQPGEAQEVVEGRLASHQEGPAK